MTDENKIRMKIAELERERDYYQNQADMYDDLINEMSFELNELENGEHVV